MKFERRLRTAVKHEKLKAAIVSLQHNLMITKFKPQQMPENVLNLDKLYLKLLHEDWQSLQTGSKVAYVPSDKYPGLSEGNLTMRADALMIFNQFFNNKQIDDDRNRDLQNYVPEMADFENYLQFQKMKQEYMAAVLGVIVSALASTKYAHFIVYSSFSHQWRDQYPKDIQNFRNIFKDINSDYHGLDGKSDEYIYGKYEKVVALVLDEARVGKNYLYAKTAEMILAIKFAEPVVEAVQSLRANNIP